MERSLRAAYNRRIMSAFHATFSAAATLGAAGAVGIVIALLPARSLLAPAPTSPAPESTAAERLREPAAKRRTVPGRIWILATLR